MMENVYVIKVKTKPPLSSLYPSERRYSASTVGGLSFVHFGLGALSLLLGTLAVSLQGPILAVACLVPFVTGLLAWRRWYIDRNIALFFYGSLFSLIAATLCFVATIFDIASATGASTVSMWSLQNILHHSSEHVAPGQAVINETIDETMLREEFFNASEEYDAFKERMGSDVRDTSESTPNPEDYRALMDMEDSQDDRKMFEDLKGEASLVYERQASLSSKGTEPQEGVQNKSDFEVNNVVSFWHESHRNNRSQAKTLLTVNVLMASLLEIFWSLLSARIALRGMMNRLPEPSYCNNVPVVSKPEGVTGHKKKPPPPRPDILDHDRRLSESLQNFNSSQSFRNSGPRLPLPESSREFRERVERFLANQAAHRVVEGSCS